MPDAVGKLNPRAPAEPGQARHIEQFLRHAVGPGRVPNDVPLEPHRRSDHLRQLADRFVLAAAHVEVGDLTAPAGLRILRIRLVASVKSP